MEWKDFQSSTRTESDPILTLHPSLHTKDLLLVKEMKIFSKRSKIFDGVRNRVPGKVIEVSVEVVHLGKSVE